MRWLKKYHRGAQSRKMNGLGFASWPDRLVLKPGVARVLWIEFKRPREKLTPGQALMQEYLKSMGQAVVTCHSDGEARLCYGYHRD